MGNPAAPVGWWLREASTAAQGPARAPADWISHADVVVVGGGYTGMWAAWSLLERNPGARVVLLEAARCGWGPSGRNGGFVHGWWDQLPYLVERFGAEPAIGLARLVDESVTAIGSWCEGNGVDAWYRRAGYLRVSASEAQDGEWRAAVRAARELGAGEEYVELTPAEVQARCASPALRGGALMPHAATVQPARLALGLRDALLSRGLRIQEGVQMLRVDPGPRTWVETTSGPIAAEQVILAMNAWAAGYPAFRTSLLTWGSHIVLTEPVPDLLAEYGWTGGEAIADARFTVHYLRTTPDGRVAFGAGVGEAGYGGRLDGRFDHDRRAEQLARAALVRFFPRMEKVGIEASWGGPIDISPDRLPAIGTIGGGRVHFAHGFSGNGVAPAHVAGRILADLATSPDGELARLPIVNRSQRRFPPEPIRYLGASLVREAMIRRDEAQDLGRRSSLLVRAVAAAPRLMGYRLGEPRKD